MTAPLDTAGLVAELRALSDCDARAGEPLGKCMRRAADKIEQLLEHAGYVEAQWLAKADALSSAPAQEDGAKDLSAHPRAAPTSPWQDIATAPKDGSMILLFNKHNGEQSVMGWTEGVMEDVFENGFWSNVGGRNAAITMSVNPNYFQFWRPLPPTPISDEGRQ